MDIKWYLIVLLTAFPRWLIMLSIFAITYLSFIIFYEVIIQVFFAHFYLECLSYFLQMCRNSLYIANTALLSDIFIVSIFFYSMACLFIFLMVSLDEKNLILMKTNLSIFILCLVFCVLSKKSLPSSRSWRYLIFPSSRSCMVSVFNVSIYNPS